MTEERTKERERFRRRAIELAVSVARRWREHERHQKGSGDLRSYARGQWQVSVSHAPEMAEWRELYVEIVLERGKENAE